MAKNILIRIFADDRTQTAFKRVGAGFSKMAKASAAMSVAAAAAATVLTVKSMRAADELAKTADKIGATTEALASLQLAGELTGVSVETMNMALQRMTRRVSEAAIGTGEAKGALFELGIDAAKLEQLPLDEQMGVVADAMKGVGSQADRVRLAMKLFDSEGVALVNTLAKGSAGLKELALEADLLGLALSRADTAKIEAANDEILRAKGVFTGLGNQLAVEFSPIIAAVATDFRQAALENQELGNVGQRVGSAMVTAIGFVMDSYTAFKLLLMQVKVLGLELGSAIVMSLQDAAGALDDLVAPYNAFARAVGMSALQVKDGYEQSLIETSRALLDSAAETQTAIIEIMSQGNPSENLVAAYEAIQAAATQTAEVVAASAAGMGMSSDSKTQEQIKNESKLAEYTAMSEKDKTKHVIDEANSRFGALGKTSKKMFAVQKAMQIAQAVMNTYTSATATMAQYPFPINVALAALTVAAGMAQVANIRSQSFEGGGFTGFGARTGGVDGKGGFPAILHPNETVVDHTKSGGRSRSGGDQRVIVNQTINIATGVAQTVRAELANLMPQIENSAKAAVADAKMRGGNYSKSLAGA